MVTPTGNKTRRIAVDILIGVIELFAAAIFTLPSTHPERVGYAASVCFLLAAGVAFWEAWKLLEW